MEQRGKRTTYGVEVRDALLVAWKAADHACSKRLAPFLAELVPILQTQGELRCSKAVQEQLIGLSASTIDRLLQPVRFYRARRPYLHTASPNVIRSKVPIRTFGDWDGVAVGHLQVDLVMHCGRSTQGVYLSTLVGVDVASGWVECVALPGHREHQVASALDKVRRCLPFPLLSLHSDNGGEFLNRPVWRYCQGNAIAFTRGRPYKKNDQAYAEQKNWQLIRRMVGYDRLQGQQAWKVLQELYVHLRLYANFFQPIRKLVAKERMGARVRKQFDVAQTPYQRLLKAKLLEAPRQQTLQALYCRLNPVQFLEEIDGLLEQLHRLGVMDPGTAELLAQRDRAREQTLHREVRVAG